MERRSIYRVSTTEHLDAQPYLQKGPAKFREKTHRTMHEVFARALVVVVEEKNHYAQRGTVHLKLRCAHFAAAQAKLRIPELDFGAPAIALASAAWILDADGAEKTARLVLSQSNDLVWVARFRQIAETKGVLQTAAWQAALALAEGRRSDAQAALLDSLEQGDSFAAEELQRLAPPSEQPE